MDNEQRAILLFQRLAEIYGHIWKSQFKDEIMFNASLNTWEKNIAHLSSHEIALGLKKCISRRIEYPPTLPMFLKLCDIDEKDVGLNGWEFSWQTKDEVYSIIMDMVGAWDASHKKEYELKAAFKINYESYVKTMFEKINGNKEFYVKGALMRLNNRNGKKEEIKLVK